MITLWNWCVSVLNFSDSVLVHVLSYLVWVNWTQPSVTMPLFFWKAYYQCNWCWEFMLSRYCSWAGKSSGDVFWDNLNFIQILVQIFITSSMSLWGLVRMSWCTCCLVTFGNLSNLKIVDHECYFYKESLFILVTVRLTKKWWSQLWSRIFMEKLNA